MKTGSFFTLWVARREIIPIVGITFLFIEFVTMGQLSTVPRDDFWITDGPVNALLVTNGLVYVGGDFQTVGPQRAFGVLVNRNTALAAPTSPKLDQPVLAAVSDGTGGWIVSQDGRLIRIHGDGSIDPNWNVSVKLPGGGNGSVNAMLVSSSRLFVGGYFTEIAGSPRNSLASLDLATGQALEWDPGLESYATVSALVLLGQNIYFGGAFFGVGGVDRRSLAAVDIDTAAPTSWNPHAVLNAGLTGNAPSVSGMSVAGTNLVVGGIFTEVGGSFRTNLAAVKLFNGFATSWNPNPDGPVYSVVAYSNTVYVTGAFTNIGGALRSSVASLDATSGVATAWNPDPQPSTPMILTVDRGTLYVAGGFRSIAGQQRGEVASFELGSGDITAWDPSISGGDVSCIAPEGSSIFIGGAFRLANGVPRRSLAAFDGVNGAATSWNPDVTGVVYALANEDQSIYVGGSFTEVGLQSRTNLAQVSTSSGQVMSWNPGSDGAVYALVTAGDKVYLGGQFKRVAEQSRTNLAAVGFDGRVASWNPGAVGDPIYYSVLRVDSLLVSGNSIYVAGDFFSLGGQQRRSLGAVDLVSGAATPFNPQINLPPDVVPGKFKALAADGNNLFAYGLAWYHTGMASGDVGYPVVGSFNTLSSATNFVNVGQSLCSYYSDPPQAVGLAFFQGSLFEIAWCDQGVLLNQLDAGSGASQPWLPATTSPYPYAAAYAIAPLGNSLIVAGSFGTVNGVPLSNIAVLPPLGYVRLEAQPLSNGGLRLEVVGDPLVSSVLQATTDFQSWSPLTTNTGTFHYDVTNVVQSTPTYYRSVSQP